MTDEKYKAKDLINLQFIKKIISENLTKFDNFHVFSNFTGNPIGENVDEGVNEFKKKKCNGVIAIGGGSAIDVGKVIACMAGQNKRRWESEDRGNNWKKGK